MDPRWDYDASRPEAERWREIPEDPPTGKLRAAVPCSQNGYSAGDRSVIHTLTVAGVQFPVRKGSAGDLLMWAADRWHREVEPLVPGTCWGFSDRLIRGSTEVSNHASGTAIDLNAPKHPLGSNPAANFTGAQIAAINWIISDAKGCLRWGGSYQGRRDPMHVEVIAPEAQCAAVLAQLKGAVNMPPNTVQQVDEIHEQLLTLLNAWGGGVTDDKNTPYTALQFLLRNNVEAHQTTLMCQEILKELQGSKQLAQADVNRIVAGVHQQTKSTVADITHRAVADEVADQLETPGFWRAAGERAAKTFAGSLLTLFGAGPLDLLHIDWATTLSLSAGSTLVSVLISIASAQVGVKGTPSLVKERN